MKVVLSKFNEGKYYFNQMIFVYWIQLFTRGHLFKRACNKNRVTACSYGIAKRIRQRIFNIHWLTR